MNENSQESFQVIKQRIDNGLEKTLNELDSLNQQLQAIYNEADIETKELINETLDAIKKVTGLYKGNKDILKELDIDEKKMKRLLKGDTDALKEIIPKMSDLVLNKNIVTKMPINPDVVVNKLQTLPLIAKMPIKTPQTAILIIGGAIIFSSMEKLQKYLDKKGLETNLTLQINTKNQVALEYSIAQTYTKLYEAYQFLGASVDSAFKELENTANEIKQSAAQSSNAIDELTNKINQLEVK